VTNDVRTVAAIGALSRRQATGYSSITLINNLSSWSADVPTQENSGRFELYSFRGFIARLFWNLELLPFYLPCSELATNPCLGVSAA
jgi:hypothetical protein